ncbi:MAG TPA: glycosyltransferase family 87 protein [Longimicrobiales bacterium]|nr:glycosyltransferase family 87 protein [Longimicrobiales bacterium]
MARRSWAFVVAVAGVIAALRVGFGVRRLLFPTHEYDGGDLVLRWREVQAWFEGAAVYGTIGSADYPPASYPMFWPFIGWTDIAVGRWIWAAATLVSLALLVRLLVRESGAVGRPLRLAVVLLPLIGYATHSTLANGQVGILVVAALLGGVLILVRSNGAGSDLVGSSLVVASLVKPTLSVPLVWVAFLVPKRLRPAALIVSGYVGLTLLASSFQQTGPVDLVRGWLGQSDMVNLGATRFNLQSSLASGGGEHLFLPAVLAVCAITGWWVYRHRNVDVWLLLGVTSFVALLWSYHRPFDDVIVLLPTLAMLRVAMHAPDGGRRNVAIVLASGLALLAIEHPQTRLMAHGLLTTSIEALVHAMDNIRVAVWLAAAAFLIREAHLEATGTLMTDRAGGAGAPITAGSFAPDARGSAAPVSHDRPSWVTHGQDTRVAEGTDTTTAGVPAGDRRRAWIALCLTVPLGVLIGAYVWLVIDHGETWLWNVVVHESGRYTLGQTMLYFRHFLREIPTVVAMALFVIAAGAPPGGALDRASELRRSRVLAVAALTLALLLAAFSFAVVAVGSGPGEAVRN